MGRVAVMRTEEGNPASMHPCLRSRLPAIWHTVQVESGSLSPRQQNRAPRCSVRTAPCTCAAGAAASGGNCQVNLNVQCSFNAQFWLGSMQQTTTGHQGRDRCRPMMIRHQTVPGTVHSSRLQLDSSRAPMADIDVRTNIESERGIWNRCGRPPEA